MEWTRGAFKISDCHEDVDVDYVETMLRASYWAPDRSRLAIEKSISRSLNFVIRDSKKQVGYARVITDSVTFAWIADVVVSPEVRGQGLGKWLMKCVLEHPEVAKSAQQLLRTRDAQSLYGQFGFEVTDCMVKRNG